MPLSQFIGIIGLGLIGGSLALSLRRARPGLRILGVDVDAGALEEALAARAIDTSAPPASAPLSDCGVVVLAQPAGALLEAVLPTAARMRPGAVLTDVCGSKEAVCARAARQDRVVFVGAHRWRAPSFAASPPPAPASSRARPSPSAHRSERTAIGRPRSRR